MKPTLSILLAAAVVAPPAGATTAPDAPAAKPVLGATLTACTSGTDPAARSATFTGSMPARRGTRRMQMRFVLFQRRGVSARFRRVTLPQWGIWEASDPGRPGFVFAKRVDSLLAPAAYRAVIAFRWYDRHGRLQRQVTRTTPTCVQPDLRADLVLAAFDGTVAGAPTGAAIYTVLVRNDGRTTAAPFEVTVGADGVQSDPVTIGPLAAGAQESATITGPRCAHDGTVTIRLDAGQAVDESDEADDTVQRACPL